MAAERQDAEATTTVVLVHSAADLARALLACESHTRFKVPGRRNNIDSLPDWRALFACFVGRTCPAAELDLSHCWRVEAAEYRHAVLQALAAALAADSCAVRMLRLDANGLTPRDVALLADALPRARRLAALSVRACALAAADCARLAASLGASPHVAALDIGDCALDADALAALADALPFTRLRTLVLAGNALDAAALSRLGAAAAACATLESLDLSHCLAAPLRADDARALACGLARAPRLAALALHGTELDAPALAALLLALPACRRLRRLAISAVALRCAWDALCAMLRRSGVAELELGDACAADAPARAALIAAVSDSQLTRAPAGAEACARVCAWNARALRALWSFDDHARAPRAVRAAIRAVLLAARVPRAAQSARTPSALPLELLVEVFRYLAASRRADWEALCTDTDDDTDACGDC